MPTYTGTSGADTITGSSGDDIIDGLAGADTMTGGAGNDVYYVDNVFDSVVELPGEGSDTVYSSVSYSLTANVETLYLTGAATSGSGNALNNKIYGNASDNTLFGDDGADQLFGGDGNDQLFGGSDSSNDLLDGGAGDDLMWGGAGNDVYYVDSAGDAAIENAGEGSDIVRSTITYTLSANIESLQLQGSSSLDGTGNNDSNMLTGNTGSNHLYGLGGVDTLRGGDGDDFLIGGLGRDFLYGEAGADDFVFLQESVDVHLLGGAVEFDFLKDYDIADGDRIDVSAIDADTTTAGDQAFTLNTTGLTGTAGEAYMFFGGGVTTIRFDVDGDGLADYVLEVTSTSLISSHVSTGVGDGGWIL